MMRNQTLEGLVFECQQHNRPTWQKKGLGLDYVQHNYCGLLQPTETDYCKICGYSVNVMLGGMYGSIEVKECKK